VTGRRWTYCRRGRRHPARNRSRDLGEAERPLADRYQARHAFPQLRTKQDDGTQVSVGVEQVDLKAIADDVLGVWDRFAEEVAKADLMVKWRVRKRGSFVIWNADGSLQTH
jgi:hypothetical protein